MKMAVIGGGSTHTPELVNGFLARINQFPLAEFWRLDSNAERLAIVGGFSQRVSAAKGPPFKVILLTNQYSSIKDADDAATQLRASPMEAHRFRVTSEIRKAMNKSISMLRNTTTRST